MTAPVVAPAAPAAPAAKPVAPAKAAPVVEVKPTAPAQKATAAAVKPAETKPAAPELLDFEFEIDGKKRTEKLTRDQIKLRLQKAMAADQRFEEGAKARQDADARIKSFAEQFKKDPAAALKKAGVNAEEYLQNYLMAEAEKLNLTPEQLEAKRLRDENAALKSDQEKRATEEKTKAEQELAVRTEQQLVEEIRALMTSQGIDNTPANIRLIAQIKLDANKFGLKMTPEQVSAEVKYRRSQSREVALKEAIAELTDDQQLVEFFGEDLVKRLAKASLGLVPSNTATKKPKEEKPAPPKGDLRTIKYMSTADFRKSLDGTLARKLK